MPGENYGATSNLFTDKMALIGHLSCAFQRLPALHFCDEPLGGSAPTEERTGRAHAVKATLLDMAERD